MKIPWFGVTIHDHSHDHPLIPVNIEIHEHSAEALLPVFLHVFELLYLSYFPHITM